MRVVERREGGGQRGGGATMRGKVECAADGGEARMDAEI